MVCHDSWFVFTYKPCCQPVSIDVHQRFCSCVGVLWCATSVFCHLSGQEAFKFRATKFASEAINGDECGDSLLCRNMCSSKDITDSITILWEHQRPRFHLMKLYTCLFFQIHYLRLRACLRLCLRIKVKKHFLAKASFLSFYQKCVLAIFFGFLDP